MKIDTAWRKYLRNPSEANYQAFLALERQEEERLGIPAADYQRAYERQQRAACWSPDCLSTITHNPL